MPMDTEKVSDPASRKGAIPFAEDVVKIDLKNELLKDFNELSDDKKAHAAALIKALKYEGMNNTMTPDMKARQLQALDQMKKFALEIGSHWEEESDAAELVSSMRR